MVIDVCESQVQRSLNLSRKDIMKPDDDKGGFLRRAKLGFECSTSGASTM